LHFASPTHGRPPLTYFFGLFIKLLVLSASLFANLHDALNPAFRPISPKDFIFFFPCLILRDARPFFLSMPFYASHFRLRGLAIPIGIIVFSCSRCARRPDQYADGFPHQPGAFFFATAFHSDRSSSFALHTRRDRNGTASFSPICRGPRSILGACHKQRTVRSSFLFSNRIPIRSGLRWAFW